MKNALLQKYTKRFEGVTALPEFRGETTWMVPLGALRDVLVDLRKADGFDFLLDISSVDHMGQEPRFEVVYELSRLSDAKHVRVKTAVAENQQVPSVSDIWRTADWHEREIFDMMGIRFSGHPDLRRIIMWEGYPYHPLRKDFPLEGKDSDAGGVAFSEVAPLEGGPFVTQAGSFLTMDREPCARSGGQS